MSRTRGLSDLRCLRVGDFKVIVDDGMPWVMRCADRDQLEVRMRHIDGSVVRARGGTSSRALSKAIRMAEAAMAGTIKPRPWDSDDGWFESSDREGWLKMHAERGF